MPTAEMKSGWIFNSHAALACMGGAIAGISGSFISLPFAFICIGAWLTAVACVGQICQTILEK